MAWENQLSPMGSNGLGQGCKANDSWWLGINIANKLNATTLAQTLCHFWTSPDCLWVQILKQTYLHNCSMQEYKVKSSYSSFWKAMLQYRDLIFGNQRWVTRCHAPKPESYSNPISGSVIRG